MNNSDPTKLPSDAEIARQVDAFSKQYLSPLTIEALQNEEDGLIVALALIQKSFEMLRLTMHTKTGAIDLFEELAATYVGNWRAAGSGSSGRSIP